MSVYSEIKKYLLYLVGFFCVVLGAHIIILYLYSDASHYALRGGTLNVGIVGETPEIDPLTADIRTNNDNNDTLIHFLYRGLLRYSNKDKKIVADLTTCSLDTFPVVRCTLTQDALWSDGSSVSIDDITATYQYFKENAKNEYTKAQLSLLEVQEDRWDAVFRFKTTDATSIALLSLPVLNQKDIEETKSDFTKNLYSGPYVFGDFDERKGTFLFKQNTSFKNTEMTQYFDQIRFGFWATEDELEDVITADITLSESPLDKSDVSRYDRPVLYGININSTRVPNTLRTAIFNDIFSNIDLTSINEQQFKKENNIFLGEIPVNPKKGIDGMFAKAAESLGYYFGGTTPKPAEPKAPVNPEKPLKYITKPGNATPVFSQSESIDIAGTAPKWTTKVTINGYALQNFSQKKRQFLYFAKKEYKNLTDGVNTYKVVFYAGKKLLDQETLTLYYDKNKETLDKLRAEWVKWSEPIVEPTVVVDPSTLDPKKLYKDGKPLSMIIVIQNDVPFFTNIAEQIQEKLSQLGVTWDIVALSSDEIKTNLQKPEFAYDMVLSSFDLGLFHYDILPFFHSNKIKNGSNISKVRNPSLDSIMERMTEQLFYGAPDKLRNFETNASKIIDQEAIFFPLASSLEYIYAKDTLLGFSAPEFLAGHELLADILAKSYLKEWFTRSKEPKTLSGFFVWLKNELFSNL